MDRRRVAQHYEHGHHPPGVKRGEHAQEDDDDDDDDDEGDDDDDDDDMEEYSHITCAQGKKSPAKRARSS